MYNFVKASLKLFYRLFYKVTIVNGEKIENAKGVVISGNHLSNHDPLLFPAFFNKEIRFMAKEELFKIFFIKQTLKATGAIPIKRGTFDRTAINQSIKLLKEGEIVGIFPEGTRNKTGTKDMLEFHDGVAMFAVKTQKPIIPMILYEKPRRWKKNYLFVGDPFELTDFYNTKDYAEATKEVFNHMVEVQKECNEYVTNLKVKKK